jgi:hypothetical protein
VNGKEAAGAKQLAARAGVELLSVWFACSGKGRSFVNANPMPSLKDREIAEAVRKYLVDG